MAGADAVRATAVARREVRKSLERLEYHLGRGARGAKGVAREVRFLDALHRQTVRVGGQAIGVPAVTSGPLGSSFGQRAARELAANMSRANNITRGRLKSSLLADFSSDGLMAARLQAATIEGFEGFWTWQANASACPTCLDRHGSAGKGVFTPRHPGCLCIPVFPTDNITRLTDAQLVDVLSAYGDPRYQKKVADFLRGDISREELASVEARGAAHYQAFYDHLLDGTVTVGEAAAGAVATPGAPASFLVETATPVPVAPAPVAPTSSGPSIESLRADFEDLDQLRIHDPAKWKAFEERAKAVELTAGERGALDSYTGGGFKDINDYLRWKQTPPTIKGEKERYQFLLDQGGMDETIDLLRNALRKVAAPEGYADETITTWRGMAAGRKANEDFLAALDAASLVEGSTITNVPFASTSSAPSVARSFNSGNPYLLEIVTKPGSGAYIKPVSRFASENEYLLLDDLTFRVEKTTIRVFDYHPDNLRSIQLGYGDEWRAWADANSIPRTFDFLEPDFQEVMTRWISETPAVAQKWTIEQPVYRLIEV